MIYRGQRFGYWTVLELDKVIESKTRSHAAVTCACQCGKIADIRIYDLENARTTGCRSCKMASQTTVESVCKESWLQYQRNASERGYTVELTLEEFTKLILSNCYYCGRPPMNKAKRSLAFYTSGVDRKDNTENYTVDNSVACCAICNRGKHAIPYDEWLQYLDELVEFRNTL